MAGIRVGYIRVSTPEQDPDRQKAEMKAEKFFVDIYTGKVLDRPAFNEMMNFIREGDTLVVHSLDRLARNLNDLRTTVLSLVDRGIVVEFITERMVFDKAPNSFGLLLLSMMGAFAEFERNLTLERSRSGIRNAKAKGIKVGGRKPKFTPELLKEIKEMKANGATNKRIATYLGLSRPSVINYLKYESPAYADKSKRGKINV